MRAELFEQVGRPGNYVLVEAWKDPQAFDAHLNTAHAKQFRDTLQPLRVTGYDERPYKNFSVAPGTGAPGGDAIHVVTHLDTIGGPQGGGPDLARKMAEASRREPGCLRYDVLQGRCARITSPSSKRGRTRKRTTRTSRPRTPSSTGKRCSL